ncbi:uncharacterized protein [Cherax quadricarinatus]|uniref:uncharacterized protein isoform X2 n=1 Tax=Cherax quadricarinatus TaxID=27406 RepID=UPI0023781791|nr:uncharacterized protein LOC128703197 isoform X3 [Cherax quadricarinatus]
MFVLPSLPSLARTAAFGGFIVIGSAFYFKSRIQDGIKHSDYYRESLHILRSHRGVAYLMGEPIKDGRLDLGDTSNNFCSGKEAKFQKMEETNLIMNSESHDITIESTGETQHEHDVHTVSAPENEMENNLELVKETPSVESDKRTETEHHEDSELKTLSHAELKKFFQEALSQLLQDDPLLKDLHPQVTLEEVNALIELEHGRAMKIYIEKADEGFWTVVIPHEATVYELKQGLKHHVALVLLSRGGTFSKLLGK